MTLLAAVATADNSLFFLCDTLISVPGQQAALIRGPHGAMLPNANHRNYRPHQLRQKCAILNGTTFVAYAGATWIATAIISQLRALLASGASEQAAIDLVADRDADLTALDTTVLLSTFDGTSWRLSSFGEAPHVTIFDDGMECTATGTGAAAFVNCLHDIRQANASFNVELGGHHSLVMKLFAVINEIGAREGYYGEFDDHFGGIIELTSLVGAGFEKLPSANVCHEYFERDGDEIILLGGNYLNYWYLDDILVFRRFGNVRGDELLAAFGSVGHVDIVYPVDRKLNELEIRNANEAIGGRSFDDSVFEAFSWAEWREPANRHVRVSAPEPGIFNIRQVGSNFEVHHSPELMEHIAGRFGAARWR